MRRDNFDEYSRSNEIRPKGLGWGLRHERKDTDDKEATNEKEAKDIY
jgi:hypothetical protein